MDTSTKNIEDLPGHIAPVVASIVTAALTLTFVTGMRPVQAATEGIHLVQVKLGLSPDPDVMRLFVPPAPLAGPEQPPSIREILADVCTERGYDESCARMLYGMMWKESQFVPDAVGDNGRALGYFQIHYRMHGVEAECATDVRCSANWTIDYLESNGYPKYVTYAVQCHNGCGIANGYAASVKRWAERKWAEDEAKDEANRLALAAMEAEVAERRLARGKTESDPVPSKKDGEPVRTQHVALNSREDLH